MLAGMKVICGATGVIKNNCHTDNPFKKCNKDKLTFCIK